MNQLLSGFFLSAALLASGCVSESTVPRYRTSKRPPVILERFAADSGRPEPRYFAAAQNRSVYDARYAGSNIAPSGQFGMRIYTRVSGIPEPTRVIAPPAGRYTRYEDYAADPRYGTSSRPSETRQLTGPRSSGRTEERPPVLAPRREVVPPPRLALADTLEPARRPLAPPVALSAADRLASGGRGTRPLNLPPRERAAGLPPISLAPGELPLALPSPGRTGFVNIPGHPQLPEIDVRGIRPGTPAEVPDPARPGETIQFRVP